MLSTGRRHGLLTLAPSAAAVKRAVYLDFPKADTRGRRLGVDSGLSRSLDDVLVPGRLESFENADLRTQSRHSARNRSGASWV